MPLHSQEPSTVGGKGDWRGQGVSWDFSCADSLSSVPWAGSKWARRGRQETLFEKCFHSLDTQRDPILGPSRKWSSRRPRVKKPESYLRNLSGFIIIIFNTKRMFKPSHQGIRLRSLKEVAGDIYCTYSSWGEPPGSPVRAELPFVASLRDGKANSDVTGRMINTLACQALAGPSSHSPSLVIQLLQDVRAITAKTDWPLSSWTQSRPTCPSLPALSVASACGWRFRPRGASLESLICRGPKRKILKP